MKKEKTELEKVYDSIDWERKFQYQIPREFDETWREAEAEKAKKFLAKKQEETQKVVRSLFLAEDSRGQVLIFCEENWD